METVTIKKWEASSYCEVRKILTWRDGLPFTSKPTGMYLKCKPHETDQYIFCSISTHTLKQFEDTVELKLFNPINQKG